MNFQKIRNLHPSNIPKKKLITLGFNARCGLIK